MPVNIGLARAQLKPMNWLGYGFKVVGVENRNYDVC